MRVDGRLRVGASIILGSSRNKVCVDWILLPQDVELLNTVLNVKKKLRGFGPLANHADRATAAS
jgi:hypothetical protein